MTSPYWNDSGVDTSIRISLDDLIRGGAMLATWALFALSAWCVCLAWGWVAAWWATSGGCR